MTYLFGLLALAWARARRFPAVAEKRVAGSRAAAGSLAVALQVASEPLGGRCVVVGVQHLRHLSFVLHHLHTARRHHCAHRNRVRISGCASPGQRHGRWVENVGGLHALRFLYLVVFRCHVCRLRTLRLGALVPTLQLVCLQTVHKRRGPVRSLSLLARQICLVDACHVVVHKI